MHDVYWRIIAAVGGAIWFILFLIVRRWWIQADDDLTRALDRTIMILQQRAALMQRNEQLRLERDDARRIARRYFVIAIGDTPPTAHELANWPWLEDHEEGTGAA